MASRLKIGNQKPSSGNNVSHSKRRTRRTFKPNLVSKTFVIDGVKRRVLMSARLLKGLNKAAVKRTPRATEAQA